ncbi:MAG: LysR family transcriptional regulator substrate-binding protein, partial [Duodenibacillus sp.]|nr:LysR family transcriptional regulator substrate-binding protein [Duodenibacillus sp.]
SPYLILHHVLLERLRDFHKDYPGVRFRIDIENRQRELLAKMESDKTDFLVFAAPDLGFVNGTTACEVIGSYRYAFYASREHYGRLEGKRLTLSELNRHPVVILRRGNSTRDWLESAFASRGLKLNVQFECDTMAVTSDLTSAGFGIGAMLAWQQNAGAPEDAPGLFEVQTELGSAGGSVVIVHKKDKQLTPAARRFISLLSRSGPGTARSAAKG